MAVKLRVTEICCHKTLEKRDFKVSWSFIMNGVMVSKRFRLRFPIQIKVFLLKHWLPLHELYMKFE